MRSTWIVSFIGALLIAGNLHGKSVEPTPQNIEKAIARAKQYLYDEQKNGTWEITTTPDESDESQDVGGAQYGGRTALAVYALLAAGESPQSEKLKPAIDRVFPFAEAKAAFAHQASGSHFGKIVIQVG